MSWEPCDRSYISVPMHTGNQEPLTEKPAFELTAMKKFLEKGICICIE